MLDLHKLGPFITIGINLVVCGAIVYYFHRRLMSVETAFMKQNQIFSSFMIEFQGNYQKSHQVYELHPQNQKQETNDLASPEAIAAVSRIMNEKKLIEVSDDSASESDDSDSDDSASESDDSDSDASTSDDSDSDASTSDDSASEADASEAGASEAGASEADTDIKTIKLSDLEVIDNEVEHINLTCLNNADLELSNQEIFQDMLNNSSSSSAMMMNSFMLNSSIMMQQGGLGGSFVFINEDPYTSMDMSSSIEEITESLEEEQNNKKVIILKEEDSSDSDSDDEDEEPIKIIKKSTPPRSPVLEGEPDIKEEEEEEGEEIIIPAPKKNKVKRNIVSMDMETGTINDSTAKEEKSENMKVDDLRKIALDKNLSTKENIKKMKKPELLALLAN